MSEAFTHEPTSKIVGMDKFEVWNIIFTLQLKNFGDMVVNNKLSVVAVEKETQKVVGAFLAMDNQWKNMLGFV